MGDSLELQKKLTKAREELSKREVEVRRQVANIEKIKVEALKKLEELKYSAQHDMEKVEHDIAKTKELNAETKTRTTSEIIALKNEIEKKYAELRSTILGKAASP
jgi:phenylalanyl-tRNA synthetase alpha subunit